MNLELTIKEQEALHMSVLTRVRHIERLIEGWNSHPDEHSDSLIKTYTTELVTLLEMEKKLI
jgi:hypothetical protein